MKKQDQEEKHTDRFRSLCSMSGLLLSLVCCIALIHVELRIQEHHRLISHSVTTCDQLETQILRKVQQNYERWKDDQGSHSQGHWRETKGKEILIAQYVAFSSVFKFCLPFRSAMQTFVTQKF